MKKYLQLDLLTYVEMAYAKTEQLTNQQLYDLVAISSDIPQDEFNKLEPVGNDKRKYSLLKRKVRWYQQELKQLGLLERVESKRGVWRLTKEGRAKLELKKINDSFQMLAFSTKLGIGIWGDARSIFEKSSEPIHLVLSSPPYPLSQPRAYGNKCEAEYVDWICHILEPIIKNLVDGGSVVLNVSNDIFIKKFAARSLYRERLVLALNDRFGLYKMDEIPWVNMSKAPGPTWWTSIKRVQLNHAWEPIYWFCNNPEKVRSNNNRVLNPISKEHQKFINKGGIKDVKNNCDGAHYQRVGAFSNQVKGTIHKNVILRGHASAQSKRYFEICKELGIARHGAI